METSITTYTNSISTQASITIENLIEKIKNMRGGYTVAVHGKGFSVYSKDCTGFSGFVSSKDACSLRRICKELGINFIRM